MSLDTERQRQALLLRTLWHEAPDATLAGWVRPGPVSGARGLAAYRANGEGLATKALAASHPTVAQLLGDESFAALARAHWRRHPPEAGDMACYGAGLADTLAAAEQLADEPYLADVARLDWAVHRIEVAADMQAPPEGLERLASDDPDALLLVMRPGLVLIDSRWPVVTIWQAHRSAEPDRFVPVREALARQQAESALVWREGWRPRVEAVAPADGVFMRALLAGQPLGAALSQAMGPDSPPPTTPPTPATVASAGFDFEPWLLRALQLGWLAAVRPCPAGPATGER